MVGDKEHILGGQLANLVAAVDAEAIDNAQSDVEKRPEDPKHDPLD